MTSCYTAKGVTAMWSFVGTFYEMKHHCSVVMILVCHMLPVLLILIWPMLAVLAYSLYVYNACARLQYISYLVSQIITLVSATYMVTHLSHCQHHCSHSSNFPPPPLLQSVIDSTVP